MKFARILVLATAALLIISGCTRRDINNAGSAASHPGVVSGVGSAGPEADRSPHIIDENRDNSASIHAGEGVSDHSYASGHESEYEGTSRPTADQSASAAAAMSTDFSEIGALDATSDNGFPGGPVDDKNRPSGPLSYQERLGKYDAHFIVPDSQKIFLTFDEGYENGYTNRILDTLKEKDVKAVFFITYPYAKTEPELVRRMIDEGHTIGNHSTAHKSFPTMPLQEAAKDIQNLHDYVKANFGYEMYLFRPPEGCFSEQTLALTQTLGYKSMFWSFAYNDWDTKNQPLSIEATDRIVSKAHPGEIMLLHAVSKTNTEILGDVIDQIRAKGFEFASYFYLT